MISGARMAMPLGENTEMAEQEAGSDIPGIGSQVVVQDDDSGSQIVERVRDDDEQIEMAK